MKVIQINFLVLRSKNMRDKILKFLFLGIFLVEKTLAAIPPSSIGNVRVYVREDNVVIKWNILDDPFFVKNNMIEDYYTKGISTNCVASKRGWYIKYKVDYGTATGVYNWSINGEKWNDGEVEVTLKNIQKGCIYYFRIICEGYLYDVKSEYETKAKEKILKKEVRIPKEKYYWINKTKERMFSTLDVPTENLKCEVVFVEADRVVTDRWNLRDVIIESNKESDIKETNSKTRKYEHIYRSGRYFLMLEEGKVIKGNIDKNGRFSLENIRPGDYFMTIEGGKIGNSDFTYTTSFILRVYPKDKYKKIKLVVNRNKLIAIETDDTQALIGELKKYGVSYSFPWIVLNVDFLKTYKILEENPKVKRIFLEKRLNQLCFKNFNEREFELFPENKESKEQVKISPPASESLLLDNAKNIEGAINQLKNLKDRLPLGYTLPTYFFIGAGNQGDQNSDHPWSVAYYLYYLYSKSYSKMLILVKPFSPSFLYNLTNEGRYDKDISIVKMFEVLYNYGCCSKEKMPYYPFPYDSEVMKNNDGIPGHLIWPSREAFLEAMKYGRVIPEKFFILVHPDQILSNGKRVKNISEDVFTLFKSILTCLEVPIIIRLPVWENFRDPEIIFLKDEQWDTQDVKGDWIGWQTFLLIGYNDELETDNEKGVFIIYNCSWGRYWGSDGLIRVSYEFMKNYLSFAYFFFPR